MTFFQIEKRTISGVEVSFQNNKKNLDLLINNFPQALKGIVSQTDKKGLFLILDDINGLAKDRKFSNWYKKFVDTIAFTEKNSPLCFLLAGLPKKLETLYQLQPSLRRIFTPIELDQLEEEDVKEFFQESFKSVHITIQNQALSLMIHYSGNIPAIMHEIGYQVFYRDNDGIIDMKDSTQGIISAAESIGKRYFEAKVCKNVRSPEYKSILNKLFERTDSIIQKYSFQKSTLESNLTEKEKKVLDNFLQKFKRLGILESEGVGGYQFVVPLYLLIFHQ